MKASDFEKGLEKTYIEACGKDMPKEKHKTFNFVDSLINPEHYKDCHCEVKCKQPKEKTDWEDGYAEFLNNNPTPVEQRDYIRKLLAEQKQEIKRDLLSVAEQGEYEDLRREVQSYFK
jgi:hypothetical protein